jgi:protein-L-isoaspartate(D-aspartate) O-methyltransferase
MEAVPRHQFVPVEEQDRAYDDGPLPIGLGQTISQPYIVGYMTELLQILSEHRILEIGTGSGYQTAILAMLARNVFTIDVHAPLVEAARERLASIGLTNVRFDVRNGYVGWPEFAPFDRILVTAGATELPEPLVGQLSLGGRMVIPVGHTGDDQVLKLIVKNESGNLETTNCIPVRFVPLVKGLGE